MKQTLNFFCPRKRSANPNVSRWKKRSLVRGSLHRGIGAGQLYYILFVCLMTISCETSGVNLGKSDPQRRVNKVSTTNKAHRKLSNILESPRPEFLYGKKAIWAAKAADIMADSSVTAMPPAIMAVDRDTFSKMVAGKITPAHRLRDSRTKKSFPCSTRNRDLMNMRSLQQQESPTDIVNVPSETSESSLPSSTSSPPQNTGDSPGTEILTNPPAPQPSDSLEKVTPSAKPVSPPETSLQNSTASPTDVPAIHTSSTTPVPSDTDVPQASTPTTAPTSSGLPYPTFEPTRNGPPLSLTDNPTAFPSDKAVTSPTATPTQISTPQPILRTPMPTPTAAPMQKPTRRPTPAPTGVPTIELTSTRTDIPTYMPVEPPTQHPSEAPVGVPVPDSTPEPNRPSTPSIAQPTSRPSTRFNVSNLIPRQTPQPNNTASVDPTPVPTTVLPLQSLLPTPAPSLDGATSELTRTTDSPTRVKSISGENRSFEYEEVGINGGPYELTMTLVTERRLQGSDTQSAAMCIEILSNYLQNRIEDETWMLVPSVQALQVALENVSLDRRLDIRRILFFFDAALKVQSPETEYDIDSYVSSILNTPKKKEAFLDYVRGSDCKDFAYVSTVDLSMSSSQSPAQISRSERANIGLIVGIAIAVLTGVLLVVLLASTRFMKPKTAFLYKDNFPLAAMDDMHHDYASEIGIWTAVEVSTISDPLPIGMQRHVPPDSSTFGSISLDYDFQKAYQGSVSELSGSHGGKQPRERRGSREDKESSLGDRGSLEDNLTNAMFSTDDDTLEAQYSSDEEFVVVAPPGTLGLILATNEDGVPVVNSVATSSILHGQVEVGDRLLYVDGEDVTVMLASDISKMISIKKEQRERVFVFSRLSREIYKTF